MTLKLNGAVHRNGARRASRTQLIIGGFLMALGFSVVAMVAVLFNGSNWLSDDRTITAVVTLALLAMLGLAMALMFARFNLRATHFKKAFFGLAPRRRSLTTAWTLLGLTLLVGVGLATKHREPAVYDRFAISIPAYDAGLAAQAAQGAALARANAAVASEMAEKASARNAGPAVRLATSAAQAASQAANEASDAAARASAPGTQVVWWVARDKPKVPKGAIPMLLGGLLIMAFGVAYPSMSGDAATAAMGNVEKLIGALFSVALVALGLGQQAAAVKVETSERLARQGLPPVNLTRSERESREYVTTKEVLSKEGLEMIRQSLRELNGQIDPTGLQDLELKEALNTLSAQLAQVSIALGQDSGGSSVLTRKDIDDAQSLIRSIDDRADKLGLKVETVAENTKPTTLSENEAKVITAALREDQCDRAKAGAAALGPDRADSPEDYRRRANGEAGQWTRLAGSLAPGSEAAGSVRRADALLKTAEQAEAARDGLIRARALYCASPTATGGS